MNRIMTVACVLALTALPLWAQDSEVERMKKEMETLKATNDVLMRQLEAQAAELRALRDTPQTLAPKILGQAQAAQLRALQNTPQTLAPKIQVLTAPSQTTAALQKGGPKPVLARVTAIALELGLVVVSAGTEDGLRQGEGIQIARAGDMVAEVILDRCDQKWSSGKITQKTSDPRIGDRALAGISAKKVWAQDRLESLQLSVDYENASLSELLTYLSEVSGLKFELDPAAAQKIDTAKRGSRFKAKDLSGTSTLKLMISSFNLDYWITDDGRFVLTLAPLPAGTSIHGALVRPPGSAVDSMEELHQLRKELDDVRSQVRSISDHLTPAWREEGVATEDPSEALRSQLNLRQGLVIREVREGSRASKAGLRPMDVIRDLDEPQFLRILREGGTIAYWRQGLLHVVKIDRAGP